MEVLLGVFRQGRPKFGVAGVLRRQGFDLIQGISCCCQCLLPKLDLFSNLSLTIIKIVATNFSLLIGLFSHVVPTREFLMHGTVFNVSFIVWRSPC